ncbi:LAMI_0G06194g1_1 [Lachancea mirantina]|uniref:LAMI_0G06194g1_1 n=1 Tax=Lachancea mirantina TaxID=1230905 RepID=A0A1G4K958_9SACH|nr:LAMI_0G06194g1_1 [Lachancea mirantina]
MGLLNSSDKEKIKRALPKASNKIIDVAVARLYIAYPDAQSWQYTGLSGAIVLVDDIVGHTFFLKLVDIHGHRSVIWDQELYANFEYHQDRTFFHTFETEDCYAGLLFEDLDEASHFLKRVQKREKYGSKKTITNKNAIALAKKIETEEQQTVVHGPRGESLIADQRQRYKYENAPPPTTKKAPPPPPPGAAAPAYSPSPFNANDDSSSFSDTNSAFTSFSNTPAPVAHDRPKHDLPPAPATPAPPAAPAPPVAPVSPAQDGGHTKYRLPPPPAHYATSDSTASNPVPQPAGAHSNNSFPFPIPQTNQTSQNPFPIPLPPQTSAPPPTFPHPSNAGNAQPRFDNGRPLPSIPPRNPAPLPPPRRGAAPPPPPRRSTTRGPPVAPPIMTHTTGRPGPPPPPRRGAAPPPPPRSSRPSVPQRSVPQPPPAPNAHPALNPMAPAMPNGSQAIPPPPPPPHPHTSFPQNDVPSAFASPPPTSFSMPPPMATGNAAPPPPPPPLAAVAPASSTAAAPPPPPPFLAVPQSATSPAQATGGRSSEATGDAGRDALLASIRGAGGITSLRKVDKSQLDKPSALLQEARGEPSTTSSSSAPPAVNGAGGAGGSLADALAAALNQRKSKVAQGGDDYDNGDDW